MPLDFSGLSQSVLKTANKVKSESEKQGGKNVRHLEKISKEIEETRKKISAIGENELSTMDQASQKEFDKAYNVLQHVLHKDPKENLTELELLAGEQASKLQYFNQLLEDFVHDLEHLRLGKKVTKSGKSGRS